MIDHFLRAVTRGVDGLLLGTGALAAWKIWDDANGGRVQAILDFLAKWAEQ